MQQRDHRIELLRFLFSIIIVSFHAHRIGYPTHPIPLGYVFVEFFLYIQGYFLFRHVLQREYSAREAAMESMRYAKKFYLKLLPYIIICVVIQYMLAIINTSIGIGSLLFSLPYEIALLSASGLHGEVLMTALWYLSGVVIVLPAFSYFLYRCRDSAARVLLPMLWILIYGALCVRYGDVPVEWASIEDSIIIFCRIIAGLAVGCTMARVVDWLQKFTFTFLGRMLLTITEIGSFLCTMYIAFFYKNGVRNTAVFTAFICLFIGVSILLSGKSLTQRFRFRPALFLGRLSAPIYIGHYNAALLIRMLMPDAPLPQRYMAYVMLSVAWGAVLLYLVKLLPRLKPLLVREAQQQKEAGRHE